MLLDQVYDAHGNVKLRNVPGPGGILDLKVDEYTDYDGAMSLNITLG